MLDDLLEVVEDHEAAAAPGDRMAELHGRVFLAERNLERGRDGEVDAVERTRFGQITEVNAARPIAEPRPAIAANEPRLAGAARAEHGEQADSGVEARGERAQLRGPADERVAFGRKVVTHLAHGRHMSPARTTRYALSASAGGAKGAAAHPELEDLDRRFDALQTVMPVPLDLRALGQHVGERFARGSAEQCLPAAGEGHDAGGQRFRKAIDFQRLAPRAMSSGAVLAQRDRAHVQSDAGGERKLGERVVVGERVARPRPPRRRTTGRSRRRVRSRGRGGGRADRAPADRARPRPPRRAHRRAARPARAVHHVGEEERALRHATRALSL